MYKYIILYILICIIHTGLFELVRNNYALEGSIDGIAFMACILIGIGLNKDKLIP